MAFAARLGPLAEELVESLGFPAARNNPRAARAARDVALQGLKSHTYLRTNHFDVEHRLNGLEERFRVNHRESLADALRQRLNALQREPEPWLPEVLSLLLELSDQPTFKSRLSDLDSLKEDVVEPQASLRWEDISKEDGWDHDPNLWATARYSDSSDDDVGDELDDDDDITSSSVDAETIQRNPDNLTIHAEDTQLLEGVREAQSWRRAVPEKDASGSTRKIAVSEIHVLREVLFMLQGLETTMFNADVSVKPAFQVSHLAWETHKASLNAFAEYGRHLHLLREFAQQSQGAPLLQIFQDCIAERLQSFDAKVAQIEACFVDPSNHVIVSLLSIMADLEPLLAPLTTVADIVIRFRATPRSNSFRYLELLFDEASLAQLTCKHTTYEFLARIFLECFAVYVRPIRQWMDRGRLFSEDEMFFISNASGQVPLSRTWQDAFELRKNPDGTLHAPRFLQPTVNKIFNAGKNIVVLRQLGENQTVGFQTVEEEPRLDYESVCSQDSELAPFTDLFDTAFERWIQSKYRKTSSILKNVLYGKCQLPSHLDALQYLYLMSNGFAAISLWGEVFGDLDALKPGWHNRYALTGLAQDAFASLLDASRLTVAVGGAGRELSSEAARDSVKTALPYIAISYRLAWPLQMIISEESLAHYQSISTLLLQIRRAQHALQKLSLTKSYWMEEASWEESALYYSSRNTLSWFLTTLQTYVSTLVLAPNTQTMRLELASAPDVDAMAAIHTSATKRMVDEACLGSRLTPIRECILDVLDLPIKLQQAHAGLEHTAELDESGTSQPVLGDAASRRETLEGIRADLDRHLRFICGGLRSVAGASSGSGAAKWDMLAEMLQDGSRG
ncbi:hypothetical protein S40293_09295 [Stachybotrys chartarum IBT 40293]|nr:hypothetical protein S40293_09295 [Stachybotrys chartarum IBT 40293]